MNGAAAGLDVAVVVQGAVRGSGQGRQALELSQAVLRRGHDLTVYAHAIDSALVGRVRFRRVPALPAVQPLDDLLMLIVASGWCARAGHDLVWAVGPTALGPNVVFNAHFSHRAWRQSWRRLPSGAVRVRDRVYARLLGALEAVASRRAVTTIVPARGVGSDLGLDEDGYRVVANGVDLEEFAPASPGRRADARRRFGFSPGDLVVAFVGEYSTARKGLDVLLRAIAAGPPHEHLLVTASGPAEALRRRIAGLGLSARVVVRGPADPRTSYAAADVVVVPSLYEPFSLVALEAAASGLPVVLASAAGAAGPLAGAAVLVEDPGDPLQLRRALDELGNDRAMAATVAKRARERASAMSWQACMDDAVDVIEALAAARIPVGTRAVGTVR